MTRGSLLLLLLWPGCLGAYASQSSSGFFHPDTETDQPTEASGAAYFMQNVVSARNRGNRGGCCRCCECSWERECTFTQASVREGEGAEVLSGGKALRTRTKGWAAICVLVTGTTKSMFASLDTSARSSLSRDEGSNEQRTPCQRRGDKKRTSESPSVQRKSAHQPRARQEESMSAAFFECSANAKKFQFSTRCAETRDETQTHDSGATR